MSQTHALRRRILGAGIGSVLVALGACTTSVDDLSGQWPIERYNVAAVGDAAGDDPEAQTFRRHLVDDLKDSGAFAEVLDPAPDVIPDTALLVTAEVRSYVECGGLMPMVSCSSRRSYLGARVDLQDCAGRPLGSFVVKRRQFLVSAGTDSLAAAAADTIVAHAGGGS